jgi:hypothetical protein
MKIKTEHLAYWYFRLNGFLNIPNFVVHPDIGNDQRTDVDLLGVRFPYRSELLTNSMQDEARFLRVKHRTYIVLAEVKAKVCNLNGPWTNKDQQNMQRVLRAVGAIPAPEIDIASTSLYDTGIYSNQLYYISLFCVDEYKNPYIAQNYPDVPQITWNDDVLPFIYQRFRNYRRQKASHGQWDEHGKALWSCYEQSSSLEDFLAHVQVTADV